MGRWADFARGLVGGAQAEAMQRHLDDDGCTRCARRLEAVSRLATLARSDAGITVPSGAKRMAKSIAALAPAVGSYKTTWPRQILMRPVFDSALEATAEGVRRQAALERQLVLEAEDHAVHVRIEPPDNSGRCHLAGQLQGRGGKALAGVPACLVANEGTAHYLVTNDWGEFDLSAELTGEAELRFLVADELRVAVKLPPA